MTQTTASEIHQIKFPFTRESYSGPDGREFGKQKVRVIASSTFKQMLKGYRHQYILDEQ